MKQTYAGWTVEEIKEGELEGYVPTEVMIQYENGDTDQDLERENQG